MSRRLRKEEELAKQRQAEDEEVVIDKHGIQIQRIYSPLVWKEVSGLKIVDVKEEYFLDVIDAFEKYFIETDILCKNTELINDPISLQSFLDRLMIYLKQMTSIVAIDPTYVPPRQKRPEPTEEEEEEPIKRIRIPAIKVAGALIMCPMIKQDCGPSFSRVRLVEGDAMKKCLELKSFLNRKVDVFKHFQCESYLKYYDVCILPEYRHQGLGRHMLRCGLDVARSLNTSVVVGIFSTAQLQTVAKGIGMETLFEVNYVTWRDAEGDLIFDDPGAGNYNCALMGGEVPPSQPFIPPKPSLTIDTTRTHKKTRLERRMTNEQMNQN